MTEPGEVDRAGGVEGFLRGADGQPGAQQGVLVTVASAAPKDGLHQGAAHAAALGVANCTEIVHEQSKTVRECGLPLHGRWYCLVTSGSWDVPGTLRMRCQRGWFPLPPPPVG